MSQGKTWEKYESGNELVLGYVWRAEDTISQESPVKRALLSSGQVSGENHS